MRTSKIPVAAAIVTAGALAVGIGQASAASNAPKITCKVHLQEQNPPNQAPNPIVGTDAGTIGCTGALGNGVQHDSFIMKLTSPPPSSPSQSVTGTGVVKFKDYFDAGTVSGVWDLKWSGTLPAGLKFTITKMTITKGTGIYRGIAGTGKGSGHLVDATHGQFMWSGTAAKLPRLAAGRRR